MDIEIKQPPSIEAQLAEVERLIEDAKRFGEAAIDPRCPELRAVAKGLRARLPGAASTAAVEIGRRIEAVRRRSNAFIGLSGNSVVALAQEVDARWDVILAALERMEEEAR